MVLINREVRSSIKTTQMLRITAVVQLPGKGKPVLILEPDDPKHRGGRLVIGEKTTDAPPDGMYGDGELQAGNEGKSLFFICDAAAQEGARYTLRLRQESSAAPLTGSVERDRELLTKLGDARKAAAQFYLNKRQVPFDPIVRALLALLEKEKKDRNLSSLAPLWQPAFEKPPPAAANPKSYLAELHEYAHAWRPLPGPLSRYLAVIGGLLRMIDGVRPSADDLKLYLEDVKLDDRKRAALWSDVVAYLWLRVPDNARDLLPPLPGGGTEKPKFGRFHLSYDLSLSDTQVAHLPIGTPKEVRRIVNELSDVQRAKMDLLWYDVASALCQPRDLKIEIDWQGPHPPLSLIGRDLHWQLVDGAIVYELTIRLTEDGPRVE